jgi:hypothetical protein
LTYRPLDLSFAPKAHICSPTFPALYPLHQIYSLPFLVNRSVLRPRELIRSSLLPLSPSITPHCPVKGGVVGPDKSSILNPGYDGNKTIVRRDDERHRTEKGMEQSTGGHQFVCVER